MHGYEGLRQLWKEVWMDEQAMKCDIDGCNQQAARPVTLDVPLMGLHMSLCKYHSKTNLEPAKRIIQQHIRDTPFHTRALSWVATKIRPRQVSPGERRVGIWD